ncbi:MAG: hypothetical protein QOG31_1233 [Thermoplasmata archaeon]|nr:hypothetical protein [Thermoplasmata archaeon]
MQWTPVEAVEPDPFWGPAAVPRLPRWDGAGFYPLPHPGAGVPLLWRNAASLSRFAAVLVGLGLFSVFVQQADLLTQLVFGAPVFEEFVKFGLALLAVAWLPRPSGVAALPVLALRMLVAWAVGAGFGILEHALSYSSESVGLSVVRMVFHGTAAGLSMACLSVLENLPDVRSRWFATVPASFFHYLVNASFPVQIAASLLLPGSDLGALWIALVTALAAGATVALPMARERVREQVRRQVRERFPALPAAIREPATPSPT